MFNTYLSTQPVHPPPIRVVPKRRRCFPSPKSNYHLRSTEMRLPLWNNLRLGPSRLLPPPLCLTLQLVFSECKIRLCGIGRCICSELLDGRKQTWTWRDFEAIIGPNPIFSERERKGKLRLQVYAIVIPTVKREDKRS